MYIWMCKFLAYKVTINDKWSLFFCTRNLGGGARVAPAAVQHSWQIGAKFQTVSSYYEWLLTDIQTENQRLPCVHIKKYTWIQKTVLSTWRWILCRWCCWRRFRRREARRGHGSTLTLRHEPGIVILNVKCSSIMSQFWSRITCLSFFTFLTGINEGNVKSVSEIG